MKTEDENGGAKGDDDEEENLGKTQEIKDKKALKEGVGVGGERRGGERTGKRRTAHKVGSWGMIGAHIDKEGRGDGGKRVNRGNRGGGRK